LEVRGPRRHFTHSKVMAWLAFDRAIRSAEKFGLDGPLDHWREVCAAIRADVFRRGFDHELGSFVQSYGSKQLDASLLLLPLVGFLPPEDPRVRGTVQAIEQRLMVDGFVKRYDRPPMTACRRGRACSSPAASGSSTPISCRGAGRTRAACLTGSWSYATTSDC
jgi:GH15 family glucan-1,4-alpha-glucosidase